MTSRLKHKLELENVNLKSAYLNESFVQIGTPLPALSERKHDKQEYVPLWEQEVRDEKGRRRFHGAFTGGYSAGYFNTVGSKEGWAPQQFKSSRANRASHMQRAEDFMDEEDRMQMNEDRQLENTDAFRADQFAGTRDTLQDKSLSSALESLVVPAKTSIGQTLLQKLGWRPGQGIGPRVTLRKLKIQEGKLGKARVGIDDDEEVEEAGKHTYAPRDTRLLVFEAKDDKEGLGYQKGMGMGRLPARRGMYGAGMGDDDEDDPYGAGPSVDLDSRHYAFDQGEEDDDVIVMGGQPSSKDTRESREDGAPASTDRWHDGRPLVPGFVLDLKLVPTDKWWPFPDIPSDWKPDPFRVWDAGKQSVQPTDEPVRGAPGRPLTHEQRGAALGEEPRVSAAKSVWEYMSEKDRERLQAFAAAAKAGKPPPPPLSFEPEPELPPAKATEIVIPPLSPRTASAALQGFMPYADDPQKQERYRSYLVSQTYNTKHPNPQLLPSTNLEDVNNELESFAQSARIFRPMSYAMSSRFTSGSSSLAASDMHQPKAGLHILDPNKGPMQFAKATSTEVTTEKVLSPREQAAADGKYGALTRVVTDFYPVKLVCKRFHVADPHPEGPPEGGSGSATPAGGSGSGFQTPGAAGNSWMSAFVHQAGTDKENTPPSDDEKEEVAVGERAPRSITEVGMAEDANQGRDTLTYVKPSIDIFKAIFASDDENDDDEDEKQLVPAAPAAPSKFARTDDKPRDPYPVDEKPVDYNTFKPVFRRGGEDRKAEDADAADKEKRKKEKKEKKKRKGVLSFDIDDDEEDAPREKPKKKPKAKREEVVEEWVEKAPVVLAQAPPTDKDKDATPRPPPAAAPSRFARKGAADLW